jgi:hypothetical protein
MRHRLRRREDARRSAQADASALPSATMAPPVRAPGGSQPQAARVSSFRGLPQSHCPYAGLSWHRLANTLLLISGSLTRICGDWGLGVQAEGDHHG